MKKALLLGTIFTLITSQIASANSFRIMNTSQNTDVKVHIESEGGWNHTWNVEHGKNTHKFSDNKERSGNFDKINALTVTYYGMNGKELKSISYQNNKNPIFNKIGIEGNDDITVTVANYKCYIQTKQSGSILLQE